MTTFWDIAPCILVEANRRFGGVSCLNHQGFIASELILNLSKCEAAFNEVICPSRELVFLSVLVLSTGTQIPAQPVSHCVPGSHSRGYVFNGNECYCYSYYGWCVTELHSLSAFLSSRPNTVLDGQKTICIVKNDLRIPSGTASLVSVMSQSDSEGTLRLETYG
jgi:hypothetical protein